MQKSKDTDESKWQTAKRYNKRDNRQNTNKSEYKGPTTEYKQQKLSGRNQNGRNHRQQNSEKTRKSNEQKYIQPVYTGPDFASLIGKIEPEINKNTSEDITTDDAKYSTDIIIPIPKLTKFRRSVKNQIPLQQSNNSYSTWELTYFKHILEIHSIFANAIDELGFSHINTKSADFLHIFGKFIRKCSSGKISPYIEELTNEEEQIYLEYTIKRNE
jgi:hypothetical protein